MDGGGTSVDFFISHAGGDSDWAEWIDQVLRRAGYTTITDLYEFEAGRNFILLMEDALQRADKVLLIWSPKARDRYMVEVEWSNAMAKHRDRVIPILVEECDVPAVLHATLRVSLTNFADGQEAGKALLQGLRGRQRPTEAVAYPGAATAGMPFPSDLQQRVERTAEDAKALRGDENEMSLDRYIYPRPGHDSFVVPDDVSEVWLVAKGFDSFLHDNIREVERAIAQGSTFRFLMHDPWNDELMMMMALTSYSNRDYRNVAIRLQSAVENIKNLAERRNEAVELRLVSWPILMGCTLFGPNDRLGFSYVELFGYKISLNERNAMTVHRSRDPKFFGYLREHFLTQWRDANRMDRE